MKIKLLNEDAQIPTKAYQGDAGFDVYSPERIVIWPKDHVQVKLGIAIEINKDEVCIMSERSGMAIKNQITSIGNVIDSGYRGEISIILANLGQEKKVIEKGDKIGQMLILKLGSQELSVVGELSDTERGDKAHNSSGK